MSRDGPLKRWSTRSLAVVFLVVTALASLQASAAWFEGAGQGSLPLALSDAGQRKSTFVPNSYIVRFDTNKVTPDTYEKTLDDFYAHLSKDQALDISHTFAYDVPHVFLGAAFEATPSAKATPSLLSLSRAIAAQPLVFSNFVMRRAESAPGVTSIHRDRYRIRSKASLRDHLARLRAHRRSFTEHETRAQSQSATRATADHWKFTAKAFGPNVLTGIDQQHALGRFGSGMKVCLFDTPIDYSNPAINGGRPAGTPCFGDGCPVAGGYDEFGPEFDGTNYNPTDTPPYQDLNVNVGCAHGSHTGGTIIGNGSQFVGVAPQARLWMYQTFSCDTVKPSTDEDEDGKDRDSVFIDAFLRGTKVGCDVFSGSFGTGGAWSDDTEPLAATVDAIAKNIATVVISAGNDGETGPFAVASPGGASHVISVGSTKTLDLPVQPMITQPAVDGIDFFGLFGGIPWTFEGAIEGVPIFFSQDAIADPSGQTDGCQDLPSDTPNLKGKITFVLRGGCPLADKLQRFTDHGADKIVLVADTTEHLSWVDASSSPVSNTSVTHFATMTPEQGKALVAAYAKNPTLTATVSPEGPHIWKMLPNPDVNKISLFSSYGPDNNARLRPSVSAPGEGILSALPQPWQTGVMSGTSMSCPLVAGAALLLRSVKGPDLPLEEVRRRILHTSQPARGDDEGGVSIHQQGFGIINITMAIELTTHVEPIVFDDLGDTPQSRDRLSQQLVVTNEGQSEQHYQVVHTPAPSILALEQGAPETRMNTSLPMIAFKPENIADHASVDIAPAQFSLGPGQRQAVSLQIHPPPDNDRMNLYSGWLEVRSDDPFGSARVAYGGIAGDLGRIPTLQSGLSPFNTNLPALFTANLTTQIQNDETVWALDDKDPTTIPKLVFTLQTATRQFYCDLVDADIDYKATIPIVDDEDSNQGIMGDFATREVPGPTEPDQSSWQNDAQYFEVSDVPVIGRLADEPDVPRNMLKGGRPGQTGINICEPTRVMVNPDDAEAPIQLSKGTYRILVRAMKWRAEDKKVEANYESYLSHAFVFDPDAGPTKKNKNKKENPTTPPQSRAVSRSMYEEWDEMLVGWA